ncbi:MAG: hypothetical protein ACPH3A_02060 [Luminiphilus sp.]
MTASRFWVGVEFMPDSVVQAAASHPRPIFCGQIAEAAAIRSALSNRLDQAEWHDLVLTSPIGQGYLLDLLRQRGPIEHIFLALPAISCASAEPVGDAPRPLDEVLLETRHAIEGFIAVLRGAEAALDGAIGAGLTLLRVDSAEHSSPMVHALAAFADEWIARETERWAAQGLSLAQLTVESVDQ